MGRVKQGAGAVAETQVTPTGPRARSDPVQKGPGLHLHHMEEPEKVQ